MSTNHNHSRSLQRAARDHARRTGQPYQKVLTEMVTTPPTTITILGHQVDTMEHPHLSHALPMGTNPGEWAQHNAENFYAPGWDVLALPIATAREGRTERLVAAASVLGAFDGNRSVMDNGGQPNPVLVFVGLDTGVPEESSAWQVLSTILRTSRSVQVHCVVGYAPGVIESDATWDQVDGFTYSIP